MNAEYLELCKMEIDSLLQKGLIRHSKSPWSCTAFYVNKHAEQERGAPRLVTKIDKDNIVKPVQKANSDLDITESEMNFPNGIAG